MAILLSSCSNSDESYKYERPVYSAPGHPSPRQLPPSHPYYGNHQMLNSINNSNYYQPAPQYAPYQQVSPYSQPVVPNSRLYSNPYDFIQPQYYPYQDNERYYVAPTYYRNVEPVGNQMDNMKY